MPRLTGGGSFFRLTARSFRGQGERVRRGWSSAPRKKSAASQRASRGADASLRDRRGHHQGGGYRRADGPAKGLGRGPIHGGGSELRPQAGGRGRPQSRS